MKTLIIVALFVAMAASQTQKRYVGSGSYSFTDETGKTIQITYVEDDNGIKITSHNFTPEQEKQIVEQIKLQNLQMQQQLNQQLSQLNHQLSQQFNQFPFQPQPQPFYPFFGFGFPPVPTFNAFPYYNRNPYVNPANFPF